MLLAVVGWAAAGAASAQPGMLDPTYGGGAGIGVRVLAGSSEHAYRITITPDGEIVVVGDAFLGGQWLPAAVRFTSAGEPDPEFGTEGLAAVEMPVGDGVLADAELQPDGRLVVGGIGAPPPGASQMLVARFEDDGELDGELGGGYVILGAPSAASSGVQSIAVRADGKILTFGGSWTALEQKVFVARFEMDGSLDESFAEDGFRVLELSTVFHESACELLLLQNDRMLAVASDERSLFLVRLLADGALDESFGDGGIVTHELEAYRIRAAVDSRGRIVVQGLHEIPGFPYDRSDVYLLRLTPDGELDPTFGEGGRAVVDLAKQDNPYGLALQGDGRILVAGNQVDFGDSYDDPIAKRGFLLRLTPGGQLDPSFGDGGVSVVAVGEFSINLVDLGIHEDGRILAGGELEDISTHTDFMAVRFLNDYIFADGFESGGLGEWAAGGEP